MIKKCLVCGKEFVTYPCLIKAGKGKYCSKKCCLEITNKILSKQTGSRWTKGQEAHNKKGFSISMARKNGKPYVLLFMPDHPNCTKRGYVREHRFVMETILKRPLTKKEVVHHKDENTLNNDPNNLELMTWKQHRQFHLKDNVHKRWQK